MKTSAYFYKKIIFILSFLICWHFPGSAFAVVNEIKTPIVVGGDRSYPPYEFIDKNGNPAGYNVELSRAIARVMGFKVDIKLGAWTDMHRDLYNGQVDILEGVSYSPSRSLKFDFTPPHTIVHHSIFARLGGRQSLSIADLRGKQVVVLKDGIQQEYLVTHNVGATIITADTHADVLRLVASGKYDYAVMAKLPGLYLIRELGLSNLEAVGNPVSAQSYCFGVRKGNPELAAVFSEGLAILKNTGEYQQIYSKWLGVLDPPGFSWLQIFRYGAITFIPLIFVTSGALLWSRTLHRQVAMRTAELIREVAERRNAEQELINRQQQLIQADKMAALGILVSGVAHEINNPNALILLNMPVIIAAHQDSKHILEEYYLKNGDFDFAGLRYSRMREVLPELMQKILDGSRRVKNIVEDLKDFARQQDPGLMSKASLNDIVTAALRLIDNLIAKSTQNFSVVYGDNIPPILANSQRIEQVVINLVMNACQALESSEQAISVKTSVDFEKGVVLLEVKDEGCGVAVENMGRLTDPFFTTKRNSGGTGLGLSVSSGIVEEHKGTLLFNSTVGIGTLVQMTLPIMKMERSI